MNIEFNGTCSQKAIEKSVVYNYDVLYHKRNSKVKMYAFGSLIAFMSFAFVLGDPNPIVFAFTFFCCVGMAFFVINSHQKNTFKMFAKNRFDNQHLYYTSGYFNTMHIEFRSNGCTTCLDWKLFKNAAFLDGMILLYTETSCAEFCQEMFSSESDWKSFSSIIKEKVEDRK